jgi:hypothetical protein
MGVSPRSHAAHAAWSETIRSGEVPEAEVPVGASQGKTSDSVFNA